MIPKEDFDCEEKGCRSLSNVYDGYAESMYNVLGNNTCSPGPVNGKIRVASWSPIAEDAPSPLFYLGGVETSVKDVQCTDSTQPRALEMYHGDDAWGTVVECTNGPELSSVRQEFASAIVTPPTLLLTRSDGKIYLIVEEMGNNPSFLYSVWVAGATNGGATELHHEFHIASTSRLVQAVVTGIVHGKADGQYVFELVRMWSECGERCDKEVVSARPFGEYHINDNVRIENLETIECGLESNADALVCLVFVVSVAVVGVTLSLCFRRRAGMDVYDWHELLRAVSLTGVNTDTTPSSDIRIFVRKDATGKVGVVVQDKTSSQTVQPRILQTGEDNLGNAVESGHIEHVESGHIEDVVAQRVRVAGRIVALERSQQVWPSEEQMDTDRYSIESTDASLASVDLRVSPTPSTSGNMIPQPFQDNDAREGMDISYVRSTWGRAASSFFRRSVKEMRA